MNKQNIVALVCFVAAAASYITFEQTSYLDENNVLHEAFFLVPVTLLLTLAGMILLAFSCWKGWRKQRVAAVISLVVAVSGYTAFFLLERVNKIHKAFFLGPASILIALVGIALLANSFWEQRKQQQL